MVERLKFYIDGAWQDPAQPKVVPVINPATEEKLYDVAAGSADDVDRAVAAARAALRELFARPRATSASRCSTRSSRSTSAACATSPPPSPTRWARRMRLSERAQAAAGLGHFVTMLERLEDLSSSRSASATPRSCASRSASAA